MRHAPLHISLLFLLVLSLLSCDKTPRGVISVNDMADLIVDLKIADVYIEKHRDEFPDDSSKLVLKQSVFKKYGITSEDYDSSLVWYAHNMEDYIDESRGIPGEPTHDAVPRGGVTGPLGGKLRNLSGNDANSDTVDLWMGRRCYALNQGARRGFITFDLPHEANYQPGDRYELAYKLCRGDNDFKVSLNVDYIDGTTTQMARATYGDGWVTVDVQSDTARQVRRVYGYVSYNIKPGHVAYVDSLMLVRTRLNTNNYGIINAQRKFERGKK